ncbi:S-adenosyl-L-methionine-dependent methyltransferase [Fistulina hepatica ATCC 64428]|uniref:S-adenosyl-L-methionine-dependent methyltransferase n=1 Tax=Fistulina hepatica ATCC 64428 TaxID=1128425 RepID=A0A0D7A1V9_9AGAR|nr:S-adenosyl-L-methionine-dependent methyltransferase [Fistulina hepatica ATCC 64428]
MLAIYPYFRFVWHCFIRPIASGHSDQRLTPFSQFYEGQAEVYDHTRNKLLRGRETMLSLSAAHLRRLVPGDSRNPLIWVDIGGGTGHNIEMMAKYMPLSTFDHIYLVDLCEPLLQIARKRFADKGWSNITVLCHDAADFWLPEWSEGVNPKGSVSFVSLSYSLSMIPSFYTVLDRIDYVLSPKDGLLSVVDFYTSGKHLSLHEKAIGGTGKECGWLSRWFWQIWFDFDHVSLSPARRTYLEYKFGTIKSYNGRNRFVLPFIIRIPYYIWLGRPRTCDVSRTCRAFEVEGGNIIGNCSPGMFKPPRESAEDLENGVPALEIGEPALALDAKQPPTISGDVTIDITLPLSSFHYHVEKPWRLPYYEHPVHKEFRTFMYSFTWEDPFEDVKYLDLSKDDTMFVITSAGDNALHYAIAAQPKRIHCVDMNPCQGHLMELKLAAIQALSHKDFFALFGDGCYPNFSELLASDLAPYLSSAAYQFWSLNDDAFMSSFYLHGYSGWAIRLAAFMFRMAGVTEQVQQLCNAENLQEQERIWNSGVRAALINRVVVAVLKTPAFCWNASCLLRSLIPSDSWPQALGVPMNQRQMLLNEGSVYDYLVDTLDPIVTTYHLKNGAYHFLLTLLGHYTPQSCPAYLTQKGFETLKANVGEVLDAFLLHTDTIINVLRGLSDWSLTRVVLMDHLDWFTPGSLDVDEEVDQVYRTVRPGGYVLLRSAAKMPWYMDVFKKRGFKITQLSARQGNKFAIDRVNMYASFWRAYKPDT